MWSIVETKIVFHAVHVRPVGPTVVAGLLCPNVVSEAIVENLRRTIEFASSASTDAVVVDCVDRRSHRIQNRRRRRNFDLLLLFLSLFFAVRKDDPVRRVREHNARFSARILQTQLKVL